MNSKDVGRKVRFGLFGWRIGVFTKRIGLQSMTTGSKAKIEVTTDDGRVHVLDYDKAKLIP